MHRPAWLLVIVLFLTGCRQHVSPWQGSWGTFTGEWGAEHGHALQISHCVPGHCDATLDVQAGGSANICTRNGSLTPQSSTSASLQLLLPDEKSPATCTVKLTRQSTGSESLTLTGAESCANVCSYPEVWAPVANATYPKKAAQPFLAESTAHFYDEHDKMVYGATLEDCYRSTSASLHALCLDGAMVALSQQRDVLQGATPGGNENTEEMSKLEEACDKTPEPGPCLRASMKKDIDSLHAMQAKFNTPGDPAQAAKEIAAISGTYRHSFQNGDVEGVTYRSTDEMTITQSSPTTIDFNIDLNFYNGHTCSIGGKADYKQNGSFVFTDDEKDSFLARPCILEIKPTAKGVDLGDPTGACKWGYCGMRGSFEGNGFTFKQRQTK